MNKFIPSSLAPRATPRASDMLFGDARSLALENFLESRITHLPKGTVGEPLIVRMPVASRELLPTRSPKQDFE